MPRLLPDWMTPLASLSTRWLLLTSIILIRSVACANATDTTNELEKRPSNGPPVIRYSGVDARSSPLSLSFRNNRGGNPVVAYVSGRDSAGSVVFLTSNGTWFYPVSAPSAGPQRVDPVAILLPLESRGSNTISLPDSLISGRVWVATEELPFYIATGADGVVSQLIEPSISSPDDPSAAVNWGFVELTYTAGLDVFVNLSFVDFVGLLLGISLVLYDGTVQTVAGLRTGAVSSICNALRQQTISDGLPWDRLCIVAEEGEALRIIAPSKAANLSRMQGYYGNYVGEVWEKYTTKDLLIDTQSDAGLVPCRVDEEILRCRGDNRGYARPSEGDIWGCNTGTFAITAEDNAVHRAIVPRLCAAFTRTTLLVDGGTVQPSVNSSQYYLDSPTNHYSRLVHEFLADGKGYAFLYDDVDANGGNTAGVLSGTNA